jgi:hypothetical protein
MATRQTVLVVVAFVVAFVVAYATYGFLARHQVGRLPEGNLPRVITTTQPPTPPKSPVKRPDPVQPNGIGSRPHKRTSFSAQLATMIVIVTSGKR